MIGFYDYTVWLTYISLMASVYGILSAAGGRLTTAVFCLALSGFLDAFDGRVARTKKDRTRLEKDFGIQIDSLSDIVCFGIGPSVIAWRMGMDRWYGLLILCLFCTAGLIRLGYFNVTEEERQQQESIGRRYYQGLPITASSVLFPLFYCASLTLRFPVVPALHIFMALMGACFVANIRVKKPGVKEILIMAFTVICVAAGAWFFLHK